MLYSHLFLSMYLPVDVQNDPGSANGDYFTTYMKARIYCEREVPPGRQFTGTIDYQYNEICEWISCRLYIHCNMYTVMYTVCILHTTTTVYMVMYYMRCTLLPSSPLG